MLKYLQKAKDRFVGLKTGITSNASAWAGQPTSAITIQEEIDLLDEIDAEIELLRDTLSQKLAEARALSRTKIDEAKIIEKRAVGIHATTPDKLVEYNIRVRGKARTARKLPQKAIIESVSNDADAIGFKLIIQGQGMTVDYWEIERGKLEMVTNTSSSTSDSATETPAKGGSESTVLQPPYPFLKSTKKLTFVDNDVVAGVRYFYRVRGANATGCGAWSEPVSAVQ